MYVCRLQALTHAAEQGENDLYRDLGSVRAYLFSGGLPLTAADASAESVSLARAAHITGEALERLQMPVLRAVLHFESGAVLHLVATPCSAKGRVLHELERDMTPSAQLPRASRGTAVLTVSCSGIQHDAPHVGGAARNVRVAHVDGLGTHPKHGVHDSAVVELAVPALQHAARFIGEVHFMSQIAKVSCLALASACMCVCTANT